MIKDCKINTIGLKKVERTMICDVLGELSKNVLEHYDLDDFKDESGEIKECDVILVNSGALGKRFSEHLSMIRNRSPFSEIILLGHKQDYKLAMKCLREGVRDLLILPLASEDLLVSIENAMRFRLASQKSHVFSELMGLLNYFGDIRKFKKEGQVFYTAYEYIKRGLGGHSFIVYEYNWQELSLKTNWKASSDDFMYDEKKVFEVIKQIDPSKGQLFWKHEDFLVIDIDIQENSGLLGVFKLERKFEDHLIDQLLWQLSYLMNNTLQYIKEFSRSQKMTNLAYRDDVTGLYNQRKLHKDLEVAISHADEKDEPFSVVFVDIDHFKTVNDGHGHLVGSHLLYQVAKEMKRTLRETDFIYRYGGDEFVVIIPETNIEIAERIGNRLLSIIKGKKFDTGDEEKIELSISIGIASYPKDAKSANDILEMADKMMYEAKKQGRGRVCLINEVIK